MKRNANLLDALLEVQTLDRVPRAGYLLRGMSDGESVTEHSWHLVFLVWSLAPEIPELDVARALAIALLHDLAEVRTGDLPRTASGYLPAGVKSSAELAALRDLLAPLGERAGELAEEYTAGRSLESRFVRSCDKLQLLLKVTVYESWGHRALAELWENPANFPDTSFPPIARLFDELRARRHHGPSQAGGGWS